MVILMDVFIMPSFVDLCFTDRDSIPRRPSSDNRSLLKRQKSAVKWIDAGCFEKQLQLQQYRLRFIQVLPVNDDWRKRKTKTP